MGAIFFCITMGMAISPAILGSVMNISYGRKLERMLPSGLSQFADKATMVKLGDPKSLLSPAARAELRAKFRGAGRDGDKLFESTLQAVRGSMEAGLRSVFILGAIGMLISFLLVVTIPEVSMDAVVEDKKPQTAIAEEAPA